MSNPRMNKLLLVGSDYASLIMNPTDSLTYPAFGDIAVALILKNCPILITTHYKKGYYCLEL